MAQAGSSGGVVAASDSAPVLDAYVVETVLPALGKPVVVLRSGRLGTLQRVDTARFTARVPGPRQPRRGTRVAQVLVGGAEEDFEYEEVSKYLPS